MLEYRDGVVVEVDDVTPPAVYVPQVISRFQGEAVLLDDNVLAEVETYVDTADPVTQLAWKRTTEFHRSSPMIATIATAKGWTSEYVDSIFIRGIKKIA